MKSKKSVRKPKPKILYLILHSHSYGSSIYVYSTKRNRDAGYRKLRLDNLKDIEAERDFLEEHETILNKT